MSAFTKRCCKIALASWIRGISKHPTSVKNNLHFRTFPAKSLHDPNKCLTFAAREPAKPLNDAQPTTNREQCQTCLNIAEVRRRKRLLEVQMCGSFYFYTMSNRIPFQKPYTSAHDLVCLLQSRGLTVTDTSDGEANCKISQHQY